MKFRFSTSILILLFIIVMFVLFLFFDNQPNNFTLMAFISLIYVDLKYSNRK